MAGAGAMLVVAPFVDASETTVVATAAIFVVGVAAHLLMLLVEFGGGHSTRNAEVAAHIITHGRYAKTFWFVGILLSLVALVGGLAVALGASVWLGVRVRVRQSRARRPAVLRSRDDPASPNRSSVDGSSCVTCGGHRT
jgi:uncharacterized membrane protein